MKTEAGSLSPLHGYLTDIMPTLIDVSGATYPETYQGHTIKPLYSRSLLPTLLGEDQPGPEWMFWEHYGERAVRKGDWKAIGRLDSGEWELYNLANDRTEMINLAGEHPGMVKEMEEKWTGWAKTHDVLPKILETPNQ